MTWKWVAILGILNLGCTSFGGPVEEVVERSKLREPNWAEIAESGTRSDDVRITYVSVRSHLRDLPLAVKETQVVTLDESESNLRSTVTNKISAMADQAAIKISHASSFHQLIREQVRLHHSKHASVTDIYYEKLRGGSSAEDFKEFYKVYVRVDYFKRHLPDLLKSISQAFKKSPHADLRQLSNKMTNSFQQLLGH